MSIRVTQKFYKVSTSGSHDFSSCSYKSGPGAPMSSSMFSRVDGSSFQSGLGQSYGEHPVHTPEKEQIKSLNNKFVSFIDKVPFLEQQDKMLEKQQSLLQQQKTAGSYMDNMLGSYINILRQQLENLGQEKQKLEVELGNMQGLVEDFKNKYEDEINKRTEMENEFVLIKKDVDEAYRNKVELESYLEGLPDEISFLRQLCEEAIQELQSRFQTHLWCCPWTTAAPWTWTTSSLRSRHSTRPEGFPEAAIADAEQPAELDIKDANANLSKLEAVLQRAKQDMVWQLCGLSLACGGLTSPGLNYNLASSFGSGTSSSSFSCTCSTRAVVVKMETCDGKLVSESSDVLPK
ncbi:Keratin, type II cytoskeletal 8 [Plecturocebus cupreus]